MVVSWNIDPEGVARAHGRPSQIAALGQSMLTVALPFRVLFPSLSIARRSVMKRKSRFSFAFHSFFRNFAASK